MANNTILLLDTQQKSGELASSFEKLKVSVKLLYNNKQLAQDLAVEGAAAAVANINENDDFEMLEYISKVSLTYSEIPIVLLTPEPIQPSLSWGPKACILVKPVSASTILKRLRLLSAKAFPYRGVLKKGMLFQVLEQCLAKKKSFRLTLNLNDVHTADLLIREGNWVSLYLDDGLHNDKLLLPFSLSEARYNVEVTSNAEVGEFEIRAEAYQAFRNELNQYLALMEKLPSVLCRVGIHARNLENYKGTLPDHSGGLLKLIDGKRDLFQIFLESRLSPYQTTQRLAFLYYAKILTVLNCTGDPDRESPIIEPVHCPKRSKELASWIMDPRKAAKQLEKKLKADIKERRGKEPEEAEFRPRRRTQPGLGKLIGMGPSSEGEYQEGPESAWSAVGAGTRSQSHQFAKSFVQERGGTPEELSPLQSPAESAASPLEEGLPTPSIGNSQEELSGSFRVTYTQDGELLEVSRADSQESSTKEKPVPAIIVDEDQLVPEGAQKSQSGVLEFTPPEPQSIEDEGETAPVEAPLVDKPDSKEGEISIEEEREGLLEEIRQLPKMNGGGQWSAKTEEKSADPSKEFSEKETSSDTDPPGHLQDSSDTEEKKAEERTPPTKLVSPTDEAEEEFWDAGEDEHLDDDDGFFNYDHHAPSGELETFQLQSQNRGRGKFLAIALVVVGVGALGIFLFTRGAGKSEERGVRLKPNVLQVHTIQETPTPPEPVVKEPVRKKSVVPPPVAPHPSPPKVPPEIAQRRKLRKEMEALFQQHKVQRSRKIFNKMKKLLKESTVLDPRAMELCALVAFDYDGQVKFAERTARAALEQDQDRAEAWWVLGMLAYERGKREQKKKGVPELF